MSGIAHQEITRDILGAAFEVHNVLGPGFREAIYEEGLVRELARRGIDCRQQVSIPVMYKGDLIGSHRLDLIVDNKVIVELKAVTDLTTEHTSILLSYLTAAKMDVGLLINFAKPSVEFKRLTRPLGSPVKRTQ